MISLIVTDTHVFFEDVDRFSFIFDRFSVVIDCHRFSKISLDFNDFNYLYRLWSLGVRRAVAACGSLSRTVAACGAGVVALLGDCIMEAWCA